METGKLSLIVSASIGGFALLLLIISVATPVWLDGGSGYTIGIFRTCGTDGCASASRAPQAGLSIFGLLLLAFSIIATIVTVVLHSNIAMYAALGLLYFSSMFIMAAYATFVVYSRDEASYFVPPSTSTVAHTTVGYSYNLCVASHYFLWTALTILAFACGYRFSDRNSGEARSSQYGART